MKRYSEQNTSKNNPFVIFVKVVLLFKKFYKCCCIGKRLLTAKIFQFGY